MESEVPPDIDLVVLVSLWLLNVSLYLTELLPLSIQKDRDSKPSKSCPSEEVSLQENSNLSSINWKSCWQTEPLNHAYNFHFC